MIKKPEHKKTRDGEYLVKIGFVTIGFLMVVAIILADYFWHLIFDPNYFDFNRWINRAIFNGSLGIVGMVLGFVAVLETLKSKENGKFQRRLSAFAKKVEAMYNSVKIVYFEILKC